MEKTETTIVAAIIMSGLIRTHAAGVANEEQRDGAVEMSLDLALRLGASVDILPEDVQAFALRKEQGKRDTATEARNAASSPLTAVGSPRGRGELD